VGIWLSVQGVAENPGKTAPPQARKPDWKYGMASTAAATRARPDTRTRILDIAQEAVLSKGFDATSIDEIVADAGISRAGFFYHFPDKNALALALIDRHILVEDAIFDGLERRASELSDEPLQQFLIMLRLLAEILDDMPNGHPGCLVATAAYQDRLFNADVREANLRATLGWRARFRAHLDRIALLNPPVQPVDLDDLADMVNVVVEGGIVMSKALGDPKATARQVLLFRAMLKRIFQP
jgi:AcrR family transcriptional regulator